MKEITDAIAARHAQIKKLQTEIDALQRAASALAGTSTAQASAGQPKAKQKVKRKRRPWSAAAREAMSKRVKASWAKRNKKSGKKAAAPKAKPKRKQHQWSAAEKAAIGKRMKAYWAKRKKAKR